MLIAAVRLRPYALPLVRPWAGASAAMSIRRGMLLAVTTHDGITGWGDCAPLPSMGEAGQARVFASLSAAGQVLSGRSIDAILGEADCESCAQARWAIETALLDAKARSLGVPLCRLLRLASEAVSVNAALGPLDEGCPARAENALAEGFGIAKIKVGVGGVDCEIGRLREIVDRTGRRLRLRLDANRAWSAAEAHRFLHRIAALPIDGIEEPLSEPAMATLAELQASLPFALAVDESLSTLGADALFESRAVRRLVIKPARIGSFAAVLNLAAKAELAGIEVIVTSIIDSAIGVTAAAHLAAALPRKSVHGLATLAWLAKDVAMRPSIVAGILTLPLSGGLGIHPSGEFPQG
jgi:o-succinylbenzoate synthase